MKKNKISKNWINKQHRDIYVRKSKIEGYRSRAIYKLEEIDQKFKVLKEVHTAIDLGAAPGSWSQYLSEKILNGRILAIDLLEFKKINRVHQIMRPTGLLDPKITISPSKNQICLLYTSPSPRDRTRSRMPSSA